MDRLRQDVRFALRALLKSPLVTGLAVLSIAIGIGANAAIFSAVDVFMLRPLPYPEEDRLVRVFGTNEVQGWTDAGVSIPDFLDWQAGSRTLELAAYEGVGVNLSGGDRPERLSGIRVTSGFFDLFGATPARGRVFTPDEAREGGARVAILSDAVWHRRFGADPSVVGGTVNLDGAPHTVVGVLPEGFRFLSGGADVLLPVRPSAEELRSSRPLDVTGRIVEGVTIERARAELEGIAGRLATAYPEANRGIGARMIPLRDDIYDEGFRQGSLIASIAVAFVLLIACANVANLLLARGAGREREIALRSALGAGRGRILRQLLTESLILALLAGVVGIGLGFLGIRGLVAAMPSWFPGIEDVGLTPRVLGFTWLVAVASGVLFGLVPAFRAAAPDLREALAEGGGRGSTGRRGGRLRNVLVAAEMALAVVLLVASGLLVRAFLSLQNTELGYETADRLAFRVTLPETRYETDEDVRAFFVEFRDRLAALPGVESVGAGSSLPLFGGGATYYSIPGSGGAEGRRPVALYADVSPGYFRTLGIPLVAGRTFAENEPRDGERVALISEALANRHWPDRNPVGERIALTRSKATIVGVVSDTRQGGPEDAPEPVIYFADSQSSDRSLAFAVHASGDATALLDPVRALLGDMDPDQPLYAASTLDAQLADQIGGQTIMPKIMAVLALVALILAVVGVYGVMAYAVSRRVHELGIRMAMGAERRDVLRLVVGQGARVAGVGIAVGLGLSLIVTRGLSLFLVGVSPRDPVTFLSVTAVLLAASLAASYVPAERAIRADPIRALKTE